MQDTTVPPASPTAPAGAAPARTLNPKMVMPFVSSTSKVFTTMVGMEAKFGKPYIKVDPIACHDVSGVVGFSGTILGSVVITMQKAVALKLVESFTGGPVAPDSPDFADAIGELANMVAGSAKKDLEIGANISVPTVIIGAGHTIARLSGVPCIVIPFQTPAGEFAVEVNIKPR